MGMEFPVFVVSGYGVSCLLRMLVSGYEVSMLLKDIL